MSKQLRMDVDEEIIVDLFAGGGGMSVAIEEALGRSPDIALNHDEDALSMHRVNHPQTRHFVADVFEVCPRGATQGRPVGLLHMSPECTHHSQASGGQPRNRKSRSLSWVGIRWAGQVSPRVITMENVKQILQWCPLIAKRDTATGRVVTLDMVKCQNTGKMVNRIAEPGERVPLEKQFLVPNKKLLGKTWNRFVRILEEMGYVVKYFPLNAADHGAPTTRVRIFMIARRDGQPIVKPEPTHFKKPTRGQRKWRPAAECIDWELPSKSIFGREKPLANEIVLQKALADSAEYFLRHGNIDISHYTILGPHSGVENFLEYEIGKPIDARIDGSRTFVKCLLYKGESPMARNANMVWQSLTSQSPPSRWYPSVGGAILAKGERLHPETGDKLKVIERVRWNNVGLDRCPVNRTVPEVSTVPTAVFAKSLGCFVLTKTLEAGYGTDVSTLTGGGALRKQSLEKKLIQIVPGNYFDFRENVSRALLDGKVQQPTAARLVSYAETDCGLSGDEAAEWVDRFMIDLNTNRKKQKEVRSHV